MTTPEIGCCGDHGDHGEATHSTHGHNHESHEMHDSHAHDDHHAHGSHEGNATQSHEGHSHDHHAHTEGHHDHCATNEDDDAKDSHEGHSHDHHSHSHNHTEAGHHDNCEIDDDEEEGVTCLAVVRETGTEISLFDAQGQVRSFSHKGDIRKLCFSSHGQDTDDLLTPCFDDDGNHGIPDEGCFCGVETPHLHAHLHDPKTCDDEESALNKEGTMEAELMKLARLTLHPTDDGEFETDNTKDQSEARLYNIPLSEHMPKQCNSQAFTRHMSGADSDVPPAPFRKRTMHKVKVRMGQPIVS
jgi:hypothetical protein